jgi:predicted metal-dependent hydrolase
MQAEAARPAIRVRRPTIDLTPEIPQHWNGGEPFATHVLDALSSVFPDGEAFFVRSVRHFAHRIEDPELARAIQAFSAQEGRHSFEHDRHVRLLSERYPALATRNRLLDRLLRWSQRRMPRLSLASTAGLEHLTALLARRLLSESDRWTGAMDPRIAPLWQWHALEEAEHKAVAFDVLQRVAPSYSLRVYALATNTIGLIIEVLDRVVYMLWKDGLLFRARTWASGWRFLLGRRGLLRGVGRDYWSWYRRDFHPDQLDDRALIATWHDRLGSDPRIGDALPPEGVAACPTSRSAG